MGFPDVTNRVSWGGRGGPSTWEKVTTVVGDTNEPRQDGSWPRRRVRNVVGADTTTHSRTTVAYRWLWQPKMATEVVWWCGGRQGGGLSLELNPSSALLAALLELFWCSSGAFLRALAGPFGSLSWRSPVARGARSAPRSVW